MNFYKCGLLDPRLNEDAERHNEGIFQKNQSVFGIEITIPKLAERCVFNLDPQRSSCSRNLSAIKGAVRHNQLPKKGSVLVTIKADLNSVGSMAVFDLRAQNIPLRIASGKIAAITKADYFKRGDNWPGVAELPTSDGRNLWQNEIMRFLAPVAAYARDYHISLDVRVAAIKEWLIHSVRPEGYEQKVTDERITIAHALERGEITYKVYRGSICFVESTHRAAIEIGYRKAPVVVALNSSFPVGVNGKQTTIRKFTISTYRGKYVDIPSALKELNTLESGWDGSHTFGESPQERNSILPIKKVISVMKNHLR